MTSNTQIKKLLSTFPVKRYRAYFTAFSLKAALILVMLCFYQQGFSQEDDGFEDPYMIGSLTGTLLTTNATNAQTFTIGNEKSHTIKNVIRLRVNEETTYYIPGAFTASVNVKIEYGHSSGSTTAITQTFEVSYDKNAGAKYNAQNYLSFDDAEYVKVTVLADPVITAGSVGSLNIKDLLSLENELRGTRYYELSANAADLTPSFNTSVYNTDELFVSWSWPQAAGNTHTQLEWTWVENENDFLSDYEQGGVVNADLLFKNNATRIDLIRDSSSYRIPLLYGNSGKLYYRIRAVNTKKAGSRTDGPWSALQQSALLPGHNDSLNWQSTISFAEEGKRKAVIQYFDGSLRSRQTVTKDNSTNTTVIAETFYDMQGRPAVQVLPAPGIKNIIGYTKNLNRFNSQADNTDPALAFDLTPLNSPNDLQLKTDSGSSKYYSPFNPQKNEGSNANLPDAEGYPYTLTRYTPDATGRIMAQSGVGSAFIMGSGHETKYYYGTPSQEELDGLFGTEVGNKTHYFKNMVKDANGQMSVSYVDMHGRTIATALAGEAPNNLLALDKSQYTNQQNKYLTQNLLDNNSNVVKNNSIEAINTLLVPARTAYTFQYSLNPDKLSLTSCTGTSLCYDCMYNLEIAITDESGDNPPKVRKYNNVKLDADDDCNTVTQQFKDSGGNVITGNNISFTDTLDAGSYIVRKTLTISEASLQTYRDAYLKKALCTSGFTTDSTYLNYLIDSVNTVMQASSQCGVPPPANTCQSCQDSLGTYAAYRSKYLQSVGIDPNTQTLPADLDAEIHTSYSTDSLHCARLCNNSSGVLATKRLLMLSDMMPYSGQYAFSPDSVIVSTNGQLMYNKYNIFSTAYGGAFYKTPVYKTSLGIIDSSIPQPVTLTPGEFAQQFSYSWAEQLLPHHPEYDRLLWAEANLKGSYDWISSFSNTETYAQASANGYLFAPSSFNDPFFTLDAGHKDELITKVTSNYRNNLSMWKIAYGDAFCKDIAGKPQRDNCYQSAPAYPGAPMVAPFTNTDPVKNDMVWNSFKNLYANERDNYVNSYIASQKPLSDDQNLINEKYVLRFPKDNQQMAEQLNSADPSAWSWYPSPDGTIGDTAHLPYGTTAAQVYGSRCDSYIDQWKQALLQCPVLAGKDSVTREQILNQITSGMAAVCKKGTGAANPYGASSVAPNTPSDGSPRSFEEVINSVFSQYGIATTDLCNPFVIEYPKPYGKSPVFIKEMVTVLDTCNCGRFAQLKADATASGFNPSQLSSFNEYLWSTYSDSLTQTLYDAMTQNCSRMGTTACVDSTYRVPINCTDTIPCGCAPVTISGVCYMDCTKRICAPTDSSFALATPQPMPEFLKCGFTKNAKCLDCAQLSAYTAEFKTLIPSPYNAGPVFTATELDTTAIRNNVLFARFINYRTGFQYNWMDYARAAGASSCNLAAYTANSGAHQNVICADTRPLTDTTGIITKESPCDRVKNQAIALAQTILQQRKDSLLANFEQAYRAKCLSVQSVEHFSVSDTVKEYHYTLYYYDMAGNLLKTVPPKGVSPVFRATFIDSVEIFKKAGNPLTPVHSLVTNYRYNSLNQVVAQTTPDASRSDFWYDRLGRLAVSRNAQQNADGKYSYTLYDALGRITEVGQKPQTTLMSQTISQDTTALKDWIITNGGVREQITRTVYDMAYGEDVTPPITILQGLVVQKNLRNRVSYTLALPLASAPDSYHAATFYTYDVHGNVDTLVQEYKGIPEMVNSSNEFKLIAYDYDLISGKVNAVNYQPGKADAFYHRYSYDAENRLTMVETSRDQIYWERDAQYSYYKHGPLSRTVLGQQQVQGVDYAYTLQGWLKGVNSTSVNDGSLDMGKDGLVSGSAIPTVARDAYGFSLNYYSGEYKPIGNGGVSVFSDILTPLGTSAAALYNGNIAAMAVNIPTLGQPIVYNFRYDQLNRLKTMDAYNGLNNATNALTPLNINDYKESIGYDPNGNILTYLRNGTGTTLNLNNYSYSYQSNSNRLLSINNSVNSSNGIYEYDAIGNVTKDTRQGVSANTWNVYGKLQTVQKTDGTAISYTYDATGQRISKTVGNKKEFYIRGATGNIMATYVKDAAVNSGHISTSEFNKYGSSLLGTQKTVIDVEAIITPSTTMFVRGETEYLLTDHRSNNMVAVNDKKLQHSTNGTTVDYYLSDVRTASYYSSFGTISNSFNDSGIDRAFNGQKRSTEISTTAQTAEFWEYNGDVGRRWNVDPSPNTSISVYNCFAGNPIWRIDIKGDTAINPSVGTKKHEYSAWQGMLAPPSSAVMETANNRFSIHTFLPQRLSNASGNELNLDYFPVKIDKLPQGFDAGALFDYIRAKFSSFMNKNISELEAYDGGEAKKWYSDNPLSSVMRFKGYVGNITAVSVDAADVITSQYSRSSDKAYWVFTPVQDVSLFFNGDGGHPLAGNREFGIAPNKDGNGYVFYTQGIDRLYGRPDAMLRKTGWYNFFQNAKDLWVTVMSNVASYINEAGGKASFNQNEIISKRIYYDKDVSGADKKTIQNSGF